MLSATEGPYGDLVKMASYVEIVEAEAVEMNSTVVPRDSANT
jgi:hypothetical protein